MIRRYWFMKYNFVIPCCYKSFGELFSLKYLLLFIALSDFASIILGGIQKIHSYSLNKTFKIYIKVLLKCFLNAGYYIGTRIYLQVKMIISLLKLNLRIFYKLPVVKVGKIYNYSWNEETNRFEREGWIINNPLRHTLKYEKRNRDS